MKLIGNYTNPLVRKISILLLEKGIIFEFVNELPYNVGSGVVRYDPLDKVPALVTDADEYWFDSPIIAECIELLDIAPATPPCDPLTAPKVRQLETLADSTMNAGLVSMREQARPAAQQSETGLLHQREKITRSLDVLEDHLADGTLKTDTVDLAIIAIARAVGYLNFRRVTPGWYAGHPRLVKLVEAPFQCKSFARTEPPKAWCVLCPPEQSHGTVLPVSVSLSTVERATNSQAFS